MKKLFAVLVKDLKLMIARKMDIMIVVVTPIVLSYLGAMAFKTELAAKPLDFAQLFPRIAVMFMLFGSMGGAFSLFVEKRTGTLKRLLLTSLDRWHILTGKMLGVFVISQIQFFSIFVFYYFVEGVIISGSVSGFILTVASLGIASSSLSVFFFGICKTEQSLHAIPTLFIFIMSALGGSVVSLNSMPELVQFMSNFTINKWANEALANTIWRGGPFIVNDMILLMIGLVLTVVGVRASRRSLETSY